MEVKNVSSWIAEPQISYETEWGVGSLNALLGSTFQENNNAGDVISASGFGSDVVLKNIESAGLLSTLTSFNNNYKYSALFGRINYIYNHKYILNLNGRRDGSSRFGSKNRFNNFGSIGAAWIFSEERMF